MRLAFDFYKNALNLENFNLIENDFVIDTKKIAGNAKYIKKNKFLLHTSFLWDYDINKINRYLKIPNKTPLYRKNRDHNNFLSSLKNYFLNKDDFIEKIKHGLKKS